jgi:hypothetical protein
MGKLKYNYNDCPPHAKEAMINYLEHKWEPGGYLSAVLENDLFGAYAHADLKSLKEMDALILWVYNFAPASCWGKKGSIAGWLKP